jgi:2-deoxy-D-gluconate 3-dehydrogenase
MMANDLDFSGKAVLVTGGSRGLGLAIASAFAAKGARVAICGRKRENLDNAVETLKGRGLEAYAVVSNVGRAEQVERLFEELGRSFGDIDLLVNNVGMNIFTPKVSEVENELWDKILDGNLKSAFMVSKMAVKMMKEKGGGKIINISSTAAKKSAQGMGVYCVAKAGMEMLTRVLASELAKDHICVNAVAPGMIRTTFSKPFWSNEELLKNFTTTIPMGRIAEPDEVVGTVLFLASNMADFITGEVINVDGGALT